MGSYIPSTMEERRQMLRSIGLSSAEDLFSNVPAEIKLKQLNLPEGKSELEVDRAMRRMAGKNRVFSSIFRGAGAYNHYIPSIVKSVVAKEEFLTAYTPYQAEISQGILQSIFEYQTMICELTGMDAANASVYDGASAAAEAAAMCRERVRRKTLISAAAHPMVLQTVKTYCEGADADVCIVPAKDGKTDPDALLSLADGETACFYLQQPNFYGVIEDAESLGEIAHKAGAKFIMGINPVAAALLKTPKECGADIAVGEGQPLGMPLSFGGPYLGFMACVGTMMRKLPGRVVGETTDVDNNRAFVLTLQAREQHIRREKASSNICTNQALCALAASVHMAALGGAGLKRAAELCYSKAHYAAGKIAEIPGFKLRYAEDFFHEFITEIPRDAGSLLRKLEDRDILGGYPVEGGILWCVTEMNSKEQIDSLIAALEGEGASV